LTSKGRRLIAAHVPAKHARQAKEFWGWFVTNFTTEALITTESTEIFLNVFSAPSVEISVSVVSLTQFTGTRWFLGSLRHNLTRLPRQDRAKTVAKPWLF